MSDKRNVISFSLYGREPLYCEGAKINARLARDIYPGWTVRFYTDETVPVRVIEELHSTGAEIVGQNPRPYPNYGRYWRFLVANDPRVDRFIIRDADSRLNVREAAAVAAWIKSGKSFHVMRDSVHHNSKMLGGMWGGRSGMLPAIGPLIDQWKNFDLPRANDRFCSEILLPLFNDDYICHDSYGHFPDATPFPAHLPLALTSFVGQIVSTDGPPPDIWRRAGELNDRAVTLERDVRRLKSTIEPLKSQLANLATEREILVAERDALVAERDALVVERDALVVERDRLVERIKLGPPPGVAG